MIAASILSDFWNDQILADEKQGLFLVLVGFILSFAFIRMSTKNAFRDIVGGKPSEGVAAATEEALATTREAVEEVRRRAERVTRPGDRGSGQ